MIKIFCLVNWIKCQGLGIVNQPLSKAVESTEEDYIITEGLFKLGIRIILRKLMLRWERQSNSLRTHADPSWRKGLWIYERTPQIGDALMDLACRSFFKECNCSVDLLTEKSISTLFENDPWFRIVTSNVEELLLLGSYDFIVIQSIHHRSLKSKIKHFKSMPWICIQGFYDVPDFQRAQWGAQRLADLWCKTSVRNQSFHATQKLLFDPMVKSRDIPLSIVLGGKDPSRTYANWEKVVAGLVQNGVRSVTLLGTCKKAKASADEIQQLHIGVKVNNLVNQLELKQCLQILARTRLLIAADGGAMHMGVAMQVPNIVSLFIKPIPAKLRLPIQHLAGAISSQSGDVKDISPSQIISKAIAFLKN